MAKGDLLQMLQSNPDILNQLGLGNQGQLIGNAMKQGNPITGNPQNFMAGMRKTMGNPNPVSPYGFVPPNQRVNMGGAEGPAYFNRQSPPPMQPSTNMGLPAQNTRFNPPSIGTPGYGAGGMGYKGGNRGGYPINGGNTGITGGMNRTYAPSGPVASTNMGMNMPPAIRMGSNGMEQAGATGGGSPLNGQQNNPYAPKSYGASWVTSPTTGKSGYVY